MNYDPWLLALSSIIVPIVVNLGGWLLLRAQKNKLEADEKKSEAEGEKASAEAAEALSGTALQLVRRWEKRVLELEAKVKDLEDRMRLLEEENFDLKRRERDLMGGLGRLTSQLRSHDLLPVWEPTSELLKGDKI